VRLGTKLILVLLVVTIIPLGMLGYLAFDHGRNQLLEDSFHHLSDLSQLKERELSRWIEDRAQILRGMAQRPLVREHAGRLQSNDTDEREHQIARQDLLEGHFRPWQSEDNNLLDFFLVGADDGTVLASTAQFLEGTSLLNAAPFVQGRQETYVGQAHFSSPFDRAVMSLTTPVEGEAGEIIAVLGAYLDPSEMTEIMRRATVEGSSEESYVVNRQRLFVTDPLLRPGAAFIESVHTEGVDSCLDGEAGVGVYTDYRDISVVGAYRWMPDLELCVLTEVDESEALAPVLALGRRLLTLAAMVAVGAAVIGGTLTRTITSPLETLVQGVHEIGRGNLSKDISVSGRDEIGHLAAAFNTMQDNLRRSREQTVRSQQLLLSLSKAAHAVHRSASVDDVHQSVRDEILALGYTPMIFELTPDGERLRLPDHLPASLTNTVERLTGTPPKGMTFEIQPTGIYARALEAQDAILIESFAQSVADSLPASSRPLVMQLTRLLKMHKGLLAPLMVGGATYGVLQVTGRNLADSDLAAVRAFANQTSIALENAARLREIRSSQDFLQSIYQGADSATFVVDVDPDGSFRYAGISPAHARLSGLQSAEVRGERPEDLVPRIPPEAAEAVAANYRRCVQAGEAIEYEEMIPMNDRDMWWLTRLTPLMTEAGSVCRIIGTSTEITRRVQVEAELREHKDRLEQKVAKRTADLERINERLRAEAKERSRAEQRVRQLLDQYITLNRLSLDLGQTNDIERMNTIVYQHVDALMDASRFIVSKFDAAEENIVATYAVVEGKCMDVGTWPPIPLEDEGRGTQSQVIRTGDPLYLQDFRAAVAGNRTEYIVGEDGALMQGAPPPEARQEPTKSANLAPMKVEGEIVGVTQVQSHRSAAYTRDDLDLLAGMANVAAIAIEKARLNQATMEELERRKQVEAALSESEARYRGLFNSVPAGLYRSTPEGEFMEANPALARMLGFAAPEDLMSTRAPMLYVDPEDRERWRTKLAEEGFVDGFEIPLYRQDGEVIWVSHNGREIRNGEGDIAYYQGAVMDITARKQAQQQLEHYTLELERSNAELEQFAYVASHDLQEPLRMISSYTQLQGRRYKGKLDADADEFIHFAVEGANRMQRLINDLLAYSHVGTRGAAFEPTDLNEILANARLNLAASIEDYNALITSADLPVIMADRGQLIQLMQNLIGNAIKFRGDAAPHVHVSAKLQEKAWRVSVQDNGIGISPEYHERVFEIFQRLHALDEYQGTGIGLAISRRIVERHGGEIWVESEPGEGASFYFTIPIREGNISQEVEHSLKGA
jgi:PAS domain S-box-containing protein